MTFQFTTRLKGVSGGLPSDSIVNCESVFNQSDKAHRYFARHRECIAAQSICTGVPKRSEVKRIGGNVELMAIIGEEGKIVSLSPISSPNDELMSAATAAVQKWLYKPYLLNGQPVEIQTKITVIFQTP